MKKLSFILLAACAATLFCSCELLEYSSSSGSGESSSATWNYSTTNNSFVIEPNVTSLTVTGDIAGKTFYYANVNTGNEDIEATNVKYFSDVTTRSADRSAASETVTFNPLEADLDETSLLDVLDSSLSCKNHAHFLDEIPGPIAASSSRAATTGTAVTELDYNDGTTTKNFWCVTGTDSSGNDVYDKLPGTLYAHNDYCNVWIIDKYYEDTETSDKTKVTAAVAQTYADTFEKVCQIEHNIFGTPSDKILVYNTSDGHYYCYPMVNYSDTHTKVNIVIYDLYGNGEAKGVLGFFTPRDYTTGNSSVKSNVGKYFYADSVFANESEMDMLLTLVHEYQHMINHGVKYIDKQLSIDANLHEMLSMLAEDMFETFFKTTFDAEPRARLSTFCKYYQKVGLREYDSSANSNMSVSYANAYAFGSWLARQYGGAALVKEMMSNDYAGKDCIVAAVNKVNDTNYTFSDLFAQFVKACLGDSTYTHNKAAAQSITYSAGGVTYKYPMTAINLFETGSAYDFTDAETKAKLKKEYTNSSGTLLLANGYSYIGPVLFSPKYSFKLNGQYGMTLHCIGTVKSGVTAVDFTLTTRTGILPQNQRIVCYIK